VFRPRPNRAVEPWRGKFVKLTSTKGHAIDDYDLSERVVKINSEIQLLQDKTSGFSFVNEAMNTLFSSKHGNLLTR